ncbi:MAG: Uma2 family endonuclease [Gemmatales bacterium]|nr:Uma2 family endonuclease [Gemmatales bacterium]
MKVAGLQHRRRRKAMPRRMTLAQYLTDTSDERKLELLDGEVVVSPRPRAEHQQFEYYLEHVLSRWVVAHDLGEVWHEIDMILDPDKPLTYVPDIVFLAKEHAERLRDGRLYGPADLCIEIESPSDRPRVLRRKYRDYAQYGVRWYWLIRLTEAGPFVEENENTGSEFTVCQEVEAGEWFRPKAFPGLEVNLAVLATGEFKPAVRGKAKRLV